jgi:hypothetical protein
MWSWRSVGLWSGYTSGLEGIRGEKDGVRSVKMHWQRRMRITGFHARMHSIIRDDVA